MLAWMTFVLTAVTGLASAAPPATPADKAVDILRLRVTKDRVFAPAPACLAFLAEETTTRAVTIAVRERHGGACGGDPATAPVIDRFRVDPVSGSILVLDVIDDEWRDYATYLKGRAK